MKWLFAVLLALNIVVFGGMIVSQSVAKEEAGMVARRDAAGRDLAADVAAPKKPLVPAAAGDSSWVGDNGGAASAVAEPTGTEDDAARLILAKERWQQQEKLRRQREEQLRRSGGLPAGTAPVQAGVAAQGKGGSCVSTASITMPEDDYHRIKGLLGQWPHAASRRVERLPTAQHKAGSYAVWMPIQGDAETQIRALGAKGFNTIVTDGGISVGIRPDKKSAQVLLNRLQAAGYSGQLREINTDNNQSQTIAKMQLTFMTVTAQDMAAIQSVVGKYGVLQRNKCG